MKERIPSSALPEAIASYWAATNDGRIEEALACFSQDAEVHDESEVHQGTSAIRSWIEKTTRKYRPVTEALYLEKRLGGYFVTARVSGTFPGSPLELDYMFTLQDKQIIKLEIQ